MKGMHNKILSVDLSALSWKDESLDDVNEVNDDSALKLSNIITFFSYVHKYCKKSKNLSIYPN